MHFYHKLHDFIRDNIILPLRAFKPRYWPILLIYFCFGFSSFVGISQSFWIKEHLSLTAKELIQLGFWASVPFTVKILFAQAIDHVTIAGDRRRSYIVLGAMVTLLGNALIIGIANHYAWVGMFGNLYHQLLLSAVFCTTGFMIQDIIADTLCAELIDPTASPERIKEEMGHIQLLGRLSLLSAIVLAAALGGYLATHYSFSTVIWGSLCVPLLSLLAALLLKKMPVEKIHGFNAPIFIGSIVIVVSSILSEISNKAYSAELAFIINISVVVYLLKYLCRDFDPKALKELLWVGIMIFIFRISPSLGPGVGWWEIDILGFDPAFFATLQQVSTVFKWVLVLCFTGYFLKKDLSRSIMILTLLNAVMCLPALGLAFGLGDWAMQHFGLGPKAIILFESTFDGGTLFMAPLLAFIAFYAPKYHKPTWFALAACYMNLALQAGALVGKYLLHYFPIERGQYENIPALFFSHFLFILCVPLLGVAICQYFRYGGLKTGDFKGWWKAPSPPGRRVG